MSSGRKENGRAHGVAGSGKVESFRIVKYSGVVSPAGHDMDMEEGDEGHLLLGSGRALLSSERSYRSIASSEASIPVNEDERCHHGNEQDICIPCDDEELKTDAEHCHARNKGDNKVYKNVQARKKLIFASILCMVFMVGEAVGGYFANSLAVMTDAAHLLTDFASFMISLFALWVASRPATKRMSFGWYRAEVIGALTSVLMIWVITGVLVYLAIERIVTNDYEIEGAIMVITSGVGVAVNIIMGIALHGHGHSHGGRSSKHGNGHAGGKSSAESNDVNINVRAAFIHVLGDLLQSVGVLTAALVIFYKPEYKIVDPICTFLFSVLVLFTTVAIMRDTLNVLMEGTPRGIDFEDIKKSLRSVSGVLEVHNLRVWSLTMDKVALSAHLAIDNNATPKEVLKEASKLLRVRFAIFECTVQIEEFSEDMKNCNECQDPQD